MTDAQAPRSVTVAAILKDLAGSRELDIEVLAGSAGTDRQITIPHPQKTGLALSGFDAYLKGGRVLVFGGSEVHYLETLDAGERAAALRRVFGHSLPCVLVTGGAVPPAETLVEADRAGVPLLRTRMATPDAIARLSAVLDIHLAPRDTVHGVLMDILGLGVLMVGESGIGKSECALELIRLGHRLVSDDVVDVRRRGGTIVIGTCPPLTRHHMELRGIGLINVRDLFGVTATRTSKRVELIVKLERWDPRREYERLGLDETFEAILGVSIASVCMPVAPGRNLAILVEVAVRNHLLRARGEHAARRLAARLDHALALDPSSGEDPEEEA
jgi:HPr kinase/phosphorylase